MYLFLIADKAGRVFPLTFACSVPRSASVLSSFEDNSDLLKQVEGVLTETREQGTALDAFNNKVENLQKLITDSSLSVEDVAGKSDTENFPDLFGIRISLP